MTTKVTFGTKTAFLCQDDQNKYIGEDLQVFESLEDFVNTCKIEQVQKEQLVRVIKYGDIKGNLYQSGRVLDLQEKRVFTTQRVWEAHLRKKEGQRLSEKKPPRLVVPDPDLDRRPEPPAPRSDTREKEIESEERFERALKGLAELSGKV